MREFWNCKEKKGPYRCQASATTQSLDGRNYFLRACAKPEEHIHAPDKLSLYRDRLVDDMKTLIKEEDPKPAKQTDFGKIINREFPE